MCACVEWILAKHVWLLLLRGGLDGFTTYKVVSWLTKLVGLCGITWFLSGHGIPPNPAISSDSSSSHFQMAGPWICENRHTQRSWYVVVCFIYIYIWTIYTPLNILNEPLKFHEIPLVTVASWSSCPRQVSRWPRDVRSKSFAPGLSYVGSKDRLAMCSWPKITKYHGKNHGKRKASHVRLWNCDELRYVIVLV